MTPVVIIKTRFEEGVHKLTVIDKIWVIILEVVAVVAEKMDIDDEIVMKQILQKN